MSASAILLDSRILAFHPVRDLIFTLSEQNGMPLYSVRWTLRVLEDARSRMCRFLSQGRVSPQDAARRVDEWNGLFPGAIVSESGIDAEIARYPLALPSDPWDRHLIAAALAAPAGTILTEGAARFGDYRRQLDSWPEAQTADEYLCSQESSEGVRVREGVKSFADRAFGGRKSDVLVIMRQCGLKELARRLEDLEDVF